MTTTTTAEQLNSQPFHLETRIETDEPQQRIPTRYNSQPFHLETRIETSPAVV